MPTMKNAMPGVWGNKPVLVFMEKGLDGYTMYWELGWGALKNPAASLKPCDEAQLVVVGKMVQELRQRYTIELMAFDTEVFE